MMGEEGSKEAGRESLSLDDDEDDNKLTSKSYSNYRSTMTSPSDSHHPLSPSIDSEPLLASPPICVEEFNPTKSPPLNLEYLNITVSDPRKEMEASASIVPGSNTYVTYLITTKTNLPDYGGSDFSVRRRFKDIITLSDRLTESYRGYFIPPRPDKSVVESQVMQKQEFVEQRRVALEKYLQKLASHPLIRKSDELRVFLQVHGKLPLPTTTDVASRVLDGAVNLPKQLFGDSGNVIGPQDVVQPAKGGRDLLRLLKELKQSVANDWGGSKSPVEKEDKEFLENKQRLHNLELQLSNASKQDILHEHLSLMLSIHLAFSDRSSALLTVQTLISELSSLNSRAVKLETATSKIFGGDKSRVRKLEELKDSIRVTEDAKSCAIREYERIKENNQNEIDRINRERHIDFVNMLKGFVTNQVAYTERIGQEWSKVSEETSCYSRESA